MLFWSQKMPLRGTKRALGPLDKRKKTKRCQACTTRRIKVCSEHTLIGSISTLKYIKQCEGGHPCMYCVRTSQTCQLQTPPRNEVEFVSFNGVWSDQATQLIGQVSKPEETLYTEHFALFMQKCQFNRAFASVPKDLLPLIHVCPSLREIAVAIGALDASRRGAVGLRRGQDSPRHIAFSSYGKSIHALSTQLENTTSVQREGVLWSTFLLGLFEVCENLLPT